MVRQVDREPQHAPRGVGGDEGAILVGGRGGEPVYGLTRIEVGLSVVLSLHVDVAVRVRFHEMSLHVVVGLLRVAYGEGEVELSPHGVRRHEGAEARVIAKGGEAVFFRSGVQVDGREAAVKDFPDHYPVPGRTYGQVDAPAVRGLRQEEAGLRGQKCGDEQEKE